MARSPQLFSIWNVVRTSWRALLASPGILFGSTALYLAFNVAYPGSGVSNGAISLGTIFAFFLSRFISAIISIVLAAALIKVYLVVHDGERPTLGELFRHRRLFWNFLFTEVMVGLIVMMCAILLILVGVVIAIQFNVGMAPLDPWAAFGLFLGCILLALPVALLVLKLAFAGFASVDHEVGPTDAIKESWRITKGRKWLVFKMFMAIVVINALGSLANLGGILVSLSLTLLLQTRVYRLLGGHPASHAEIGAK